MSQAGPFLQDLGACADKALVGMKAVNLGRLIRAAFPVPGGFVVTTAAFHYARGAGAAQPQGLDAAPARNDVENGKGASKAPAADRPAMPADLAKTIGLAYRELGSPPVAVRSSATAEDMAGASMAGQYDTFLDITNEESLIDAVRCCWASIDSPRTRTYFREHGIDVNDVAMAVVVQELVPADVAGVLFTANPQSGTRREMLVEASWGLGEAVVSGRVQPDVLRIDRQTGRVIEARFADKQIFIPPGGHEERPVDEQRRRISCLRSSDVAELWRLGAKAAEHFGAEQDIEFAIHGGELYLLQARPITTLEDAEAYEQLLQSTRVLLRGQLASGRGPWVVHNLGETLAHPTPLTWSVIRRFMSGSGGFGAMYREAGFEPSSEVMVDGFLERIAGKVYMDLARAPGMFLADFPFRYDPEAVRRNPDAANAPPTIPAGTARKRMAAGRRLGAAVGRLREMAEGLDQRLRDQIIPAFVQWCGDEARRDLTPLSSDELIALWRERERRVLEEFGPQSLLPSLLSGMALADLQTFLEENFWDEDPRELAELLSSARAPDRTAIANAELYEVAQGTRTTAQWLAEYGHRAPDEFDLATPRWIEQPRQLEALAAALRGGADPAARQQAHVDNVAARTAALAAQLSPDRRAELERRVGLARRYLPYREDGKYYLMLGYRLLRDLALEMGRRLEAGDGVFHLTDEELFDALRVGFAPFHLIAQRRMTYRAEAKVRLPQIIGADDIPTLGEPPKVQTAGSYAAYALSAGVARGPVRIVRSPQEAGDLGRGYVLVCTSTDPAWTPLFVNAAALVLECGGALSHGALVAREMGIPAVVLAQATALLPEGQEIVVDGHGGAVTLAAASDAGEGAVASATEPQAPVQIGYAGEAAQAAPAPVPRALIPPPRGPGERAAMKLAGIALAVWGIYLLLTFALPETWLYRPSMAVLDAVLWPLVRSLGRPVTVVIAAAAMAGLTMLGQRLFTDNRRLREAKRRADLLRKQAATLPAGSARRIDLARLASPVQGRLFIAALVPLCLLLGPMIMTFLWFPARVDPASWNAPPGSDLDVVAVVDGECLQPVVLQTSQPLSVDSFTPASATVPPIRRTLEKLLAEMPRPVDLTTQPLDLRAAAEVVQAERVADLKGYLKAGVPPQNLHWKVRSEPSADGRYPITVSTAGHAITLHAVLGDRRPPDVAEVEDAKGPIRSVKIVYPAPEQKRLFWSPFNRLCGPGAHAPDLSDGNQAKPGHWQRIAHKLGPWDAGWLVTYLVAYLPAMYFFRRVLAIA